VKQQERPEVVPQVTLSEEQSGDEMAAKPAMYEIPEATHEHGLLISGQRLKSSL
jgi:hypothetical protein